MKTSKTLIALACTALFPVFAAHAAPGDPLDTDFDGVGDASDAFPCDWRRTSVAFVPGENDFATLLFEDNWPARGDLDFNDGVLLYRAALFFDASGNATGLRLTLVPRAIGARISSGLALHLPVPAASTRSILLTVGEGAPSSVTPLAGETELVVPVASDLRALFGGATGFLNTDPTVAAVGDGTRVTLEIEFAQPVSLSLASDPFDLYFFRSDDPGYQIHRPEFRGTATMRTALFGTGDDGSTGTRAFVDRDGLPFVLSIPQVAAWPLEREPIDRLYPDVVAFAASGGANARDFYLTRVDAAKAYASGGPSAAPGLDYGLCEAPSCTDGARNGPETDLDCGGTCGGCPPGGGCRANEDCASEVCVSAACVDTDERACTVENGTGTQLRTNGAFGPCVATACDPAYHLEGGACVSDTRACAVANGSGTQTFAGGEWGPCTVQSCNAGFHLEGGACVSDSRPCAIANGTGSQTWNGSDYGACTVVSCNSGYSVSGNACVQNQPTYSGSVTCGADGIEVGCGGNWGMRLFPFTGRTYEVEISRDPAMVNNVSAGAMWSSNPNSSFTRWEINSEATFTPAITFAANTTYYVRLVETNAGVRTPSSTITSFTTRAACQFGDFMYRSDAFEAIYAYGGLTPNSAGDILVGDFPGDTSSGRINRLSSNLRYLSRFATGGDQVFGIDVDETGAVWGHRNGNLDIAGQSSLMVRWSSGGTSNTPSTGARPPTCTGPGTNGSACSATFTGHHFGWGPAMSCTDAFNRNCCNWGDPGLGCNGRFQSGYRGAGLAVRSSSSLYVVDEAGDADYNHWHIFNGSSYSTVEAGVFGINNKFSGIDARVNNLGQGAWVGGAAGSAGYFVWQTGVANAYAHIWFAGDATQLRPKFDSAINQITNPSGFRGSLGGTQAYAFSANRFSGAGYTTDRLPILYNGGTASDRRHVAIFSRGSIVTSAGASSSNPTTTELTWRRPASTCGQYQHAPLIGITSARDRYIYASDGAYVYKYFRH